MRIPTLALVMSVLLFGCSKESAKHPIRPAYKGSEQAVIKAIAGASVEAIEITEIAEDENLDAISAALNSLKSSGLEAGECLKSALNVRVKGKVQFHVIAKPDEAPNTAKDFGPYDGPTDGQYRWRDKTYEVKWYRFARVEVGDVRNARFRLVRVHPAEQ